MDATPEPMIRLDGVSKKYDDGTVAVHDLDLDVPEGETVVLVGPSGCGKSTTLKMVNRLIEPTGGRILLEGEDVTHVDPVKLRRRMGYVIQQTGLFPHQTIAANVATVPKLLGWDRKKVDARVHELLELVGLDPKTYAKRYPHQLSGGQRQRVGVARALAADPPVLLMDEPFGAVDPVNREVIQDEFLRMQRSLRKTVLFVSHDIDEAVKMADRVAIFRAGRLEQYAAPDELLARPINEFVAGFVGTDRTLKRLRRIHVRDVMTPASAVRGNGALTVQPDDDLRRVAALFLEHGVDEVACVDAGQRVIGRLTRAAVAARLAGAGEVGVGVNAPGSVPTPNGGSP